MIIDRSGVAAFLIQTEDIQPSVMRIVCPEIINGKVGNTVAPV